MYLNLDREQEIKIYPYGGTEKVILDIEKSLCLIKPYLFFICTKDEYFTFFYSYNLSIENLKIFVGICY